MRVAAVGAVCGPRASAELVRRAGAAADVVEETAEPTRSCPGPARYAEAVGVPSAADPRTLAGRHDGEFVTRLRGDADPSPPGGSAEVCQRVSGRSPVAELDDGGRVNVTPRRRAVSGGRPSPPATRRPSRRQAPRGRRGRRPPSWP